MNIWNWFKTFTSLLNMIWWIHICEKKYYLLALTDSIPRHEIDACFKFYIKDRYEPEGILIVLKKQQKSCLSCKKKYLKLNWHEYEFNMSRMEAIEDRKNVSILSFFWKSDYDFHDFFLACQDFLDESPAISKRC